MTDSHHLAIVHDYGGAIDAIREWVLTQNFTNQDVECSTGFADGYVGKVIGESQVKRLGTDGLFALLQGVGLAVSVVVDPTALDRCRKIIAAKRTGRPRRDKRGGEAPRRIGEKQLQRLIRPVMKELSLRAIEARRAKISPAKRRKMAKHASRARWGKPKRIKVRKKPGTAAELPPAQG